MWLDNVLQLAPSQPNARCFPAGNTDAERRATLAISACAGAPNDDATQAVLESPSRAADLAHSAC